MHRVNRKGLGNFDERNAGGRDQAAMELRHFQSVISKTSFHPTISSHVVSPRGHLQTSARNIPPPPSTLQYMIVLTKNIPPCFQSDFIRDSQWNSSPFKQRQEYREHVQRLGYISQHIQDYNDKAITRHTACIPTTDFPAMHPKTKELIRKSPRTPRRPTSCRGTSRSSRSIGITEEYQSSCGDYKSRLLAYVQEARLAMLENEVALGLPPGWDTAVDKKGRRFYIDHNTQTTTWTAPGYDDE